MIGLHLLCRYVRLPFPFSSLPSIEAHVRYQSHSGLVYDINLRATHTMILSIRGVTIPIYLVSSAMDSIRQCVVLFKPVAIPASDPKSEFLYQSSVYCAEPTDSPEPPRTPGKSPMPSSPHITHTVIVQVLSQSTLSRSYVLSMLNVLVTASQLKLSRAFHLNVTTILNLITGQ